MAECGDGEIPVPRPSLLRTGVSPAGDTAATVRNDGKTLCPAMPGAWAGHPDPWHGPSLRAATIGPRERGRRPVPPTARCRPAPGSGKGVRRVAPSGEPALRGDTPLRQTHASVGDVCSEHQVCASPRERVPRPFVSFRPHSYGMRQSLPARCRGVNFLQGSEVSPRAA